MIYRILLKVAGNVSLTPLQRPSRRSIVCEAAPTKKADSAAKRARQAEKRRIYNKARKSEVKTRMKKVYCNPNYWFPDKLSLIELNSVSIVTYCMSHWFSNLCINFSLFSKNFCTTIFIFFPLKLSRVSILAKLEWVKMSWINKWMIIQSCPKFIGSRWVD